MLALESKFPNFQLSNQFGAEKNLYDYEGKWFVLFVYPKDDTPGCTIEGKGFNAALEQFSELDSEVVGLSADNVESHKSFCDKFDFGFDLLADPGEDLLSQLEIGQTEFGNQSYWNRTTFLINPEGILKKVYNKVDPKDHELEILKDLAVLAKKES